MKRTIAAIVLLLGTITMLGSTAAQAATSPIVIHEIYYNSPGKDTGANASLNAEWVQLNNNSGRQVALTPWTLRDRAGHVYTFGTYKLKAHGSVKVHTGKGSNTQSNRYWGHSWYIWNNNGDGATLKNASAAVVSRCSYSDPGETRAFKVC